MIFRSWLDGVKRVQSAKALLGGVFVLTFAMALPLALTLRGMIESHLGNSLVAAELADGFSHDWFEEFWAQAAGLGTSFGPAVIGFAAVLDNLDGILDAQPPAAPVAAAIGAYFLAWTFLSGGIIDRYARQRATRSWGFFGAGGLYFFRFLRLAAIAGAVYLFLFTVVHGWLFDDWYHAATQDLTVERTAFLWRMGMYGLFGTLLVGANMVFDYAKIRAVVEDRRSMLFALTAAGRFIARNPARTLGLYALNATAFLALLGVWAAAAPGAGGSGVSMWAAFLAGQLYIFGRLFLKLTFIASQIALFQASLAHAAYTAAPVAVWPESPAAETLAPTP